MIHGTMSIVIYCTQETKHLLPDEGGNFLCQTVLAFPKVLERSPVLSGYSWTGGRQTSNTGANIFATVEKRLPDMQKDSKLLFSAQDREQKQRASGNKSRLALDT
ncbi:hypothetical protein ccbrp13_00310 [Ktedonobacteria bacterium brp13]|nr:hypothetical protein ccbrp13_00310 [Ktedonobacteria bacterium brp13]